MENVEDSDENTKLYDSAYSFSCSNCKSTCSSKSNLSESNSSGSSGYGGTNATTDFSKTGNQCALAQIPIKKPEEVEEPEETKVKEEITVTETIQTTQEDVEVVEDNVPLKSPPTPNMEMETETDKINSTAKKDVKDNSNRFFCVVSMNDGVVMYTTVSISTTLGFPADMWIGKPFTDFLHPEDRSAFASQVSNALTLWRNVNAHEVENHTSTFFYRIRRYKLLTSGFVRNRMDTYVPFHLKIHFKKIGDEALIYLVIQATSFLSAYKVSNEKIMNPVPFVMKQSPNGNFKYVDRESISSPRYLPQGIIDKNTMHLYHPSDLSYLRQVHENMVNESPMKRSEPFRMLAQNENYVIPQTELYSFMNPWWRRVEYIAGKNFVVEGPSNPNVFDPSIESGKVLCEEDVEYQTLRDSIKQILSQTIAKPSQLTKEQMNKRSLDIAAFMENFIDEASNNEDEVEQHDVIHMFKSYSLELGGMSPHDVTDSKSSVDTPVSYTQLNYDDTLQRYFDRQENKPGAVATDCFVVSPNDPSTSPSFKTEKKSSLSEESFYDNAVASTSSNSSWASSQTTSVWLTKSVLKEHNDKMKQEFINVYYNNRNKESTENDESKLNNIQEHLARCNASFEPTSASLRNMPRGIKRPLEDTPDTQHKWRYRSMRSVRRKRLFPNIMSMPKANKYLYQSTAIPTSSASNMYYCTLHAHNRLAYRGKQPVQCPTCLKTFGTRHSYSPINQLPFTLEQSCKEYINHREKSNRIYNRHAELNQKIQKRIKLSNSDGTVENTDGESSFSSFYSSIFMAQSRSSEDLDATKVKKRKGKVSVKSEMVYKYQISTKTMDEVLSGDRKKMEILAQSPLVNEQLGQLYMDLYMQGVASRLTLEEGITSSSSSGEEASTVNPKKVAEKLSTPRRPRQYSKMTILYDEEASMPPPEDSGASGDLSTS